MKTNILKCWRRFQGEYYAGQRMAGNIHIYTSSRQLIRTLRKRITNREQRNGKAWKAGRVAFYAGALNHHRQERAMCRKYRL